MVAYLHKNRTFDTSDALFIGDNGVYSRVIAALYVKAVYIKSVTGLGINLYVTGPEKIDQICT